MNKKKRFVTRCTIVAVVILFGVLLTNGYAADELPTVKWKCVTSMGQGTIWWDEGLAIPKMVKEMSGGRFTIEVFPPGAIVPSFQALDAVVNGSVECCNTWASYFGGKNRGLNPLDCVGAGMNNWDRIIWYYQHGGEDIANELFGTFGLIGIMNYVNCHEQGFLTKNKPINSVEDLKGMKLRCANPETREALVALGAQSINMPGGEVYEGLKRGVIDGLEMGTTYPDYQMGLHEIVDYWSVPIWHQRSCSHWFIVSKKAYEKLPSEYQAMLKTAGIASCMLGSTEQEYMSAEGAKKFLEAGVKQVKLDDRSMAEIEKAMVKVKKDFMKDPNYKKVVASMQEYLDYMRYWSELTRPYGPTAQPPFTK